MNLLQQATISRVTKAAEPIGTTNLLVLEHSARTAASAVLSMIVALGFHLPQSYWAPLTTLVITQSSLGSTLAVSWQRFVGTALGAVVGAIAGRSPGPKLAIFAIGLFLLGILCAVLRSDRSAYRFSGVTLAIVLLVPRAEAAQWMALHRFVEVSIGIAVALIMTLVWPEKSAPTTA